MFCILMCYSFPDAMFRSSPPSMVASAPCSVSCFAPNFVAAIVSSLVLASTLIFSSDPARSQLIPDATLPTPSQVDTIAPNTYRITGGTQAESNLFHSFQQFNLATGEVAQFALESGTIDAALTNAIIRITGGRVSQIDGAIVSDSNTNLVFINPQGWVFGANAQLDVGGAIAFSQAEAVVFADGSMFPSQDAPGDATVLSVMMPIGLQLGAGSPGGEGGNIRMTGNGHDLTVKHPILAPIERNGATDGLRGAPANLLMLVGDNVAITGGTVTAASGQLSIVAARNGFIPLGLTIEQVNQLDPALEWGEITLSEAALLDVTGPVSGRLDLIGDRIQITGGSIALSQQFDDSVPDFPGAGLYVYGDREVLVSGMTADGRLQTRINSSTLQGTRQGGAVVVRTGDLRVTDGAAIATRSFSLGRGGDLTVETTESVQLLDVNASVPGFFSNLTATSLIAGRAGDLRVTTDRIFARNGGTIASSTFGLGDGGNVTVTAHDRIELTGVDLRQFSPSVIIASSFGQGNAGNLEIYSPEIILSAGGRIDASTFNSGIAGSVTVTADRLTVEGEVPSSVNPSLILSSANILDPALRELLNVPDVPTGDSGDVRLFVNQLEVNDGARVTVRNDGTGDAGRLQIMADRLTLRDRGSLSAVTNSGEGGNITVSVGDSLQLRQEGTISATAGGTGNGGNLDLNAATIVALENSDITANAVTGRGGNISLSTQGLFGATLRSQLTPSSDITASSRFGLTGNIRLETPDLTTNQGAVILSTQPLNTAALIQPDCQSLAQNQFIITGRSGQQTSPIGVYAQTIPTSLQPTIQQEWLDNANGDRSNSVEHRAPLTTKITSPTPIRESQTWQRLENGAISLVSGQGRPAVGEVSNCYSVHD